MAKMSSGERRASILLVILIVVLIGGMLVFYRCEALSSRQVLTIPTIADTVNVIPSNHKTSRKHASGKKRTEKSDTDSLRKRKKSDRGCSGYQGKSRDYLDEPVN